MKNNRSSLRQQAEAFLDKNSEAVKEISSVDVKKLVEDLHIHQIELEIQNEELRQAQLELEASRDRYSDLYDFAPMGYVTVSDKGLVIQANLSFLGMVGIERGSLIGTPFSRFIHEKDQDVYYFHRKKLFETNTRKICELKLVTKDRTPFYVQLESAVLRHRKEDIEQILTAITDINERKRSEIALRQSREQLRIAVESGKMGTWNRNLITGETVWNPYLYELLGRDPGPPVTGETFFTYIHPDDVERIRRHVDETIQKETNFFDQFRVVRDDKAVRWLEASGRVYRDGKGRTVRIAGVNYDITDRKQAEEMLRRSEACFRSFIELTGQFGWITDAKGKVIEDLPALAQYTGLSTDDLKGWGWLQCIHPDDRECTESIWKNAVAAKDIYEDEFRVRRYDGEYRHFMARGKPIYDDYESVKEWVGVCFDLTERKEIERLFERSHEDLGRRVHERTAELNRKKQELEDVNQDLLEEIKKRKNFETELKEKGEKILAAYRQRDFLSKKLVDLLEKERHDIGNSLHDHIGQILTGVKLELEGLKKALTANGSELSDRVEKAQRLLREAIIQARNISHNLRSDVLERFGLIASLKDLVDEVRKQSGLRIHLFTKNVPQNLKEDGIDLALYRLTQETLTNITKHAGAKEVFINLTRKDQYISLTIEDDGSGFDYDTLLNQRKSSKFPLGITIMKERVSMLGGEFRIESSSGRGTHIHVQIPLNH